MFIKYDIYTGKESLSINDIELVSFLNIWISHKNIRSSSRAEFIFRTNFSGITNTSKNF